MELFRVGAYRPVHRVGVTEHLAVEPVRCSGRPFEIELPAGVRAVHR